MFRCKDCKAVYKDKIDYCECGNNVFEEIQVTPEETSTPVKSSENTSNVPKTPYSYLGISFFTVCLIFSVCFVSFLGPKPQKRVHNKVANVKTETKQIPKIDSIWDDTPSYRVKPAHNDDLNLYKNSLREELLSKVDTNELEGSGSCEIEFVLDRHGVLKRKKLYSNTANKRLLDAAKGMLGSVNTHNPPPKSYAGTPIKLEFSAQNGSYVLKYTN